MTSIRIARIVRGLAAGAIVALVPSISVFAQEEAVEEIIVTGSLIKKESFDTSSPIEVMNSAEIAEQGTPSIGEIIRNSTFNYGVESVSNILGANPQLGSFTQADFRGLGPTSTLLLLDGKRTISRNLQTSYPQILIERIESLTDGGSALYGTDAVAGVLNLIPRKDFEGLEVQASNNSVTDGSWDETAYAFIGGSRGDRGGFVVALETREKDMMQFLDRPQYTLGAPSFSSTPWPGNFVVPNRTDATGTVVSRTQRRDPGCGLNNVPGATKKDGVLGKPQGTALASTTCLWEFGQNFTFQPNYESTTAVAIFDQEISDSFSVEGEFLVGRQNARDTGSPSNPGGRTGEMPVIPGEHPGNPYRAFIDLNNNGVFEAAGGDQLLYAQDADGDGIPDRDLTTVSAVNPYGDVILGGGGGVDPTQGIPFNEDVRIAAWRPVGYPLISGPSRTQLGRAGTGGGNFDQDSYRWSGQINYDMPDSSWSGFLRYTYNYVDFDGFGGAVESQSSIANGLTGDLVAYDPNIGKAREFWFNPFTTQNYQCVNRDCSGGNVQTDPDQINSTAVYDSVARYEPTNVKQTYHIAELIATGDLFELPAGPVSTAIGMTWEDYTWDVNYGGTYNSFDAFIGVGEPDYKESRETWAAIAELQVPILENDTIGRVEFDGSVRSQWVSDNSNADLDHTDYKVGMRWEVRDWVSLRGSFGTAFIAPTIPQLFDGNTQLGLSNTIDRFYTSTSGFLARTLGGNPNLEPEEADVYNIGVSFRLLDDDLNISFDWHDFDFQDRIIRPVPQEIVDAERDRAAAAGFCTIGATGACSQADANTNGIPDELEAWLASGMASDAIQRNSITGIIEVVDTDLINAQTMKWSGFDTNISYRFNSDEIPFVDADFGQFTVGLQATYVDAYDYTAVANGPEIHGAGKRNNNTAAVPAAPKWRAILRTAWTYDRHNVAIYGRYIDHLNNASAGEGFCAVSAFVLAVMEVTNPCVNQIGRYITWDMQYDLSLDGLVWGDRRSSVTLGLINAFDTDAKAISTLGGIETATYDPRGRIWYARITQQL